MSTNANNRKKRSRDSKSLNQDRKPREYGTDPNTSDVNSFEDFMENLDILHHMAHIVGNPLKLLIGILPKVSKRCGAAAEQALAMLVDLDMKPFRGNTDEGISTVIRRCPNIKKLSLSCCSLSCCIQRHLFFEALKTNSVLQTLDLSQTGINTQDAKYLAEVLRMNSTLKELKCAAARPFLDCQ